MTREAYGTPYSVSAYGTPYSVGEVEAFLGNTDIDIYPQELMKWMLGEIKRLEETLQDADLETNVPEPIVWECYACGHAGPTLSHFKGYKSIKYEAKDYEVTCMRCESTNTGRVTKKVSCR